MPFTGRLENQPLLDVIQIVAYSQQSGILSVKGTASKGLVIFEGGNVVCAYSPSALSLLIKAAKESDERRRLTFRRVQVLTALRELFDLGEGDYRFVKKAEPVVELEGLDIKSFYAAGALDTGDLLLVLEKAMDEDGEVALAVRRSAAEEEKAETRRFPRFGPVVIKGELRLDDKSFAGFLTNVSLGGTFFHADELPENEREGALDFELPWDIGLCRLRAKVVWVRSSGPETKRGAGLSFLDLSEDAQGKIARYVQQFQELAAYVDFEA